MVNVVVVKLGIIFPENEIWLNLLGDKGGHSTKLMVSILNTVKPLSRNQILLALYEVLRRI
jgi:hypothetical protein